MSFNKGSSKSKATNNQSFDQTSDFRLSDRAAGLLTDSMGRIGGMEYQAFDPNSTQQFMNPYNEQVVDSTMNRLNYEGDRDRNELTAGIAKAGAFGDKRRGVMEAELEGQIDRNRSETLAGLNQRGYSDAQQIALGENANQNQFRMAIEALLAQLASGFGNEGTTNARGTSTGVSTQKGRNMGFGFTYGGGGS